MTGFNDTVDVHTEVDKELPMNKLPQESTSYMQDFLDELADDDGKIRAILHDETILNTLAINLYTGGYRSAIRELYNNEARACRTARDKHGARPRIELTIDVGERHLILEGIDSLGIDKSVFAQVLRVVGKSGNKSGNEVGKFGMGFISYALLCDVMILETFARVDDSRYALVCDVGCSFTPAPEPDMQTFGTRLRMSLKEDVSIAELIDVVQDLAQFSGVKTKINIENGDVFDKYNDTKEYTEGTIDCYQYSSLKQYVRVNTGIQKYVGSDGKRLTNTRKVKDKDVEYHSNKIVFFKEFHHDDEDLEFYGYLALEVAMNPDGSYKYHDEARFVGGNIACGDSQSYSDSRQKDSLFLVGVPIKGHEDRSWDYNTIFTPMHFAINIKNERKYLPLGSRDMLKESSTQELYDTITEFVKEELENDNLLAITTAKEYLSSINKDVYGHNNFRYFQDYLPKETDSLVNTLNSRYPTVGNNWGRSLGELIADGSSQVVGLRSLRTNLMNALTPHMKRTIGKNAYFIRVANNEYTHNALKEWGVVIGEEYKAEHSIKIGSTGQRSKVKKVSDGDRRCIVYNGNKHGQISKDEHAFGTYGFDGCSSRYSTTVKRLNKENTAHPHSIIQIGDKEMFMACKKSLEYGQVRNFTYKAYKDENDKTGKEKTMNVFIPANVIICQAKKGLKVDTYSEFYEWLGNEEVQGLDGKVKLKDTNKETMKVISSKPQTIVLYKDRWKTDNLSSVICYDDRHDQRYYMTDSWKVSAWEGHNDFKFKHSGYNHELFFRKVKGFSKLSSSYNDDEDTMLETESAYFNHIKNFSKEQEEVLSMALEGKGYEQTCTQVIDLVKKAFNIGDDQ